MNQALLADAAACNARLRTVLRDSRVVPETTGHSHVNETDRDWESVLGHMPNPFTSADYAERRGVSRQLANYHIRRMARGGLISRIREADGRVYYEVKQ